MCLGVLPLGFWLCNAPRDHFIVKRRYTNKTELNWIVRNKRNNITSTNVDTQRVSCKGRKSQVLHPYLQAALERQQHPQSDAISVCDDMVAVHTNLHWRYRQICGWSCLTIHSSQTEIEKCKLVAAIVQWFRARIFLMMILFIHNCELVPFYLFY